MDDSKGEDKKPAIRTIELEEEEEKAKKAYFKVIEEEEKRGGKRKTVGELIAERSAVKQKEKG